MQTMFCESVNEEKMASNSATSMSTRMTPVTSPPETTRRPKVTVSLRGSPVVYRSRGSSSIPSS